jgi:hypothetical protein
MRQSILRAHCARIGAFFFVVSLAACGSDDSRQIDGQVRFVGSGQAIEGATVDLLALRSMGMPMSKAVYVVIASTRTRADGTYAFDVEGDRLAMVELHGSKCRWNAVRAPLRFADWHTTVMLDASPSPCDQFAASASSTSRP